MGCCSFTCCCCCCSKRKQIVEIIHYVKPLDPKPIINLAKHSYVIIIYNNGHLSKHQLTSKGFKDDWNFIDNNNNNNDTYKSQIYEQHKVNIKISFNEWQSKVQKAKNEFNSKGPYNLLDHNCQFYVHSLISSLGCIPRSKPNEKSAQMAAKIARPIGYKLSDRQ